MMRGLRGRPSEGDPNGYIVSEDAGENLYHYDTLERAIQGADQAMTEGAEQVDVWHAAPGGGVEIDYDSTVEYHRSKRIEEECGR
jgi:hypothetical protein